MSSQHSPEQPSASAAEPAPWWRRGVVYQIYPRSFAPDTTDPAFLVDGVIVDGVKSHFANSQGELAKCDLTPGEGRFGSLAGITGRLDYLAWLGVDALWLSPFYRSPMADFGYDVADHCAVDPSFGTLGDFDYLLDAAHAHGLRVVVDWVGAHTSDRHRWFEDARRARDAAHRPWYVWRDPAADGGPPNNWRAAFAPDRPAWTLDEATGQYYLHSFLPAQPDLDWSHAPVREAMHEVLRFWLARGVDGFRADVVHNFGKDPALADVDAHLAALPHVVLNEQPATHEWLREIRRLLDGWDGDRMMVGEVFQLERSGFADYYGSPASGPELHLVFDFSLLFSSWDAGQWHEALERSAALLAARDAWPTLVLGNHDQPRIASRYGNEARARAAAVLMLAARGTPFLFQGEELGLADAEVAPAQRRDPGGRDGSRAPIPWLREDGHGWPQPTWLPFPPDAARLSVEAQRDDLRSNLWLYRRMLAERRASAALTGGSQELLEGLAPGLLGWRRVHGDEERLVLANFRDDIQEVSVGVDWQIRVASGGIGEGRLFDGQLAPETALLLAPGRSR